MGFIYYFKMSEGFKHQQIRRDRLKREEYKSLSFSKEGGK